MCSQNMAWNNTTSFFCQVSRMLWLIPFLLICLFLLFRFVSPYEPVEDMNMEERGGNGERGWRGVGDWKRVREEGFVAPLLVSAEFKKAYQSFVTFDREFIIRWKEALLTAYSLEQSQPTTKEPTEAELNTVVEKLTQTMGKPFPKIMTGEEKDLPLTVETLDDLERFRLLDRIPSTAQPHFNALEWMNEQMRKAQKELDAVMGGGFPSLEGFAGAVCAELATCFKENPDLVKGLLSAQQEEAAARLERIQRELMSRFEQFQQTRLVSAMEQNGRLRVKSKEIQEKAKSGDWVKDVRMGTGTGPTEPQPVSPPGGSALDDLQRSDPARYAQLKATSGSWLSVKSLMEQINRNLR